MKENDTGAVLGEMLLYHRKQSIITYRSEEVQSLYTVLARKPGLNLIINHIIVIFSSLVALPFKKKKKKKNVNVSGQL